MVSLFVGLILYFECCNLLQICNTNLFSLFLFASCDNYLCCLWLQPHGFFNCSPAVDVPPSAWEMDAKENDVKDNGVAKPSSSILIAKL